MDEKTSYRLCGWVVMVMIVVIMFLCSDGNSQDCDKLYEFTKKQMSDKIMDATPTLYGVYECVNVGTNLSAVADTVLFVILVQREGQEAELFGIYEVYPDGRKNILPTLFMVIDERIIVGVSSNAPVGTKFFICLKEIYEKQKALLYK